MAAGIVWRIIEVREPNGVARGSTVSMHKPNAARLVALFLIGACTQHRAVPAGAAGNGAGGAGNLAVAGTGAAGTGAAGTGATAGGGAAGTGGAAGAGSLPGSCAIGGQSYPDGATGIPDADGCNSCTCLQGELACTTLACGGDPEDCVMAKRLDTCCRLAEPHMRADFARDECLVPYVATNFDEALLARCQPEDPSGCQGMACGAAPPSRVLTKTGEGACVFADECSSAQDCVQAVDSRGCCTCSEVMPVALLAQDPCFTVQGSTAMPPAQCAICTTPIACLCAEPGLPFCSVGDPFNVCIGDQIVYP